MGLVVAGFALGAILLPGSPGFAIGVSFVLAGAVGFGLFRYSIPSVRRKRLEEASGYTTIPTPHRADLDLVDPRTGKVVRGRGQAEISEDEFRRLIG
ncbi:MAG: hypothetical protein ABI632_09950 [Pseudolysinimonas sp.]